MTFQRPSLTRTFGIPATVRKKRLFVCILSWGIRLHLIFSVTLVLSLLVPVFRTILSSLLFDLVYIKINFSNLFLYICLKQLDHIG